MLNLPEIGNLVSLLSAGIMYVIVLQLQPLKEAIKSLQKSIDRLIEKTEENTSEISHVREVVSVHENSLKTLFKKTDSLQEDVDSLERRCENCPKRKE